MSSVVWITGAGGFLGTELVRSCDSAGLRMGLIGKTLPVSFTHCRGVAGTVEERISSTALENLRLRTGSPSVVFHLAGGASVSKSFSDPQADFDATVSGSSRLFSWLSKHAPETKIILASSAAVYGQSRQAIQSEVDELNPVSPYGWHKKIVEDLAKCYQQTSELRILPIRIFSLFGTDLRKQIFWDVARRVASGGGSIELMGTGEEQRDWVSVEYAAQVIRSICVQDSLFDRFEGALNLGGGRSISVRYAIQCFMSAFDQKADFRFNGKAATGDPSSLVADVRRLRKVSSHVPEAFEVSIERLATHYRTVLT